MNKKFPKLGFGLGLRTKHYPYIFEHKPKVDWFEIISENFMDTGGRPRRNLAKIRADYPVVMHGVSMSIGTIDPLNSEYLTKLKNLIADVEPTWISDHLCWTGVAHKNTHDLLPVPYTHEALKHIVSRIKQVQDFLGMRIAIENPSTYLEFKSSEMSEAEFIAEMAKEADCNLLLDVNNVFVTCYNHRLDAKKYLDALPLSRVIQIHLSGHTNKGNHIIDTHDDHIVDGVWQLYKYVVDKAKRTPNTMIEWDDNIPEFPVLFAELEKAKDAAKDCSLSHWERVRVRVEQNTHTNNASIQLLQHPHPCPLPVGEGEESNAEFATEQARMQDAILLGAGIDSKPDEWIRTKEDFAPTAQLGVYVNAYRFRLYDVTAEDYPVLKYAMGNKDFEKLIKDFVNIAQSEHFNIGRYAKQLPDFVSRNPLGNKFLVELCALETAISQLMDAAETAPLEAKHLEGFTPEKLMENQLYPRDAMQLFAFEYPVNDYYREVMEELAPALPLPSPSFVAVFRNEDVMWRMDLEADEYKLLAKLFSGETVGDALSGFDDAVAEKLSEWFSRWMRNGLLAAHEYNKEQPERIVA